MAVNVIFKTVYNYLYRFYYISCKPQALILKNNCIRNNTITATKTIKLWF